ncbi:hypothetical protein B0H11DRAFT_2256979 [Mycena galericulata]|nr:hypothetical protein B0H11DRAFT_2256979 [Mycena galericulata]
MSEPSQPLLAQFLIDRSDKDGIYDSTFTQLRTMDNALANREYLGTKKRSPNLFRGSDWAKNIVFKEATQKDGPEFKLAIIGSPFKPVDDKSKARDVIVLQAPSYCDLDLLNLYYDQTAILQDIENKEHAIDEAAGQSKKTHADSKDLITITTLKKYGIPASAGGPKVAAPPTPKSVKRVKRKFTEDSDDSNAEPEAPLLPVANRNSNEVKIPAAEDIKLGAYYDPRVLEDYRGPYFQQTNAKLMQLDVRDVNNKLIPPWRQYAGLRNSTLVLALVTVHIYTFTDGRGDSSRDRKTVQLNAHSIRVLDESDYPVQKRTPPIPRTMLDDVSAGPSTPVAASSSANGFKNFVVTPRSGTGGAEIIDTDMESAEGGGGDDKDKTKRRRHTSLVSILSFFPTNSGISMGKGHSTKKRQSQRKVKRSKVDKQYDLRAAASYIQTSAFFACRELFLYHLLEACTLSSLISLSHTSTLFRTLVKTLLRIRLTSLVESFVGHENVIGFFQVLESTDSALTGSCIPRVLAPPIDDVDEWFPNNLNIYPPLGLP